MKAIITVCPPHLPGASPSLGSSHLGNGLKGGSRPLRFVLAPSASSSNRQDRESRGH